MRRQKRTYSNRTLGVMLHETLTVERRRRDNSRARGANSDGPWRCLRCTPVLWFDEDRHMSLSVKDRPSLMNH